MDYFELSYLGGWQGSLSFCVDSNRIFFFPRLLQSIEGNTTKYGLLPDSVYNHINSVISHLKLIHSQDPDSLYCYDCSEVSIKTINGTDTMRLFLAGDIDSVTWDLIRRLEKYEKDSKSKELTTAYFFLETQRDLIKMPPKIIEK
jgi:hypothetical protein